MRRVDAYPDTDGYGNSDIYANGYTYGNVHSDSNGYGYIYANSNGYRYVYSYANPDWDSGCLPTDAGLLEKSSQRLASE